LEWAVGKPGEFEFIRIEATNDEHFGRRRIARDLFRRAAGIARQRNLAGAATEIIAQDALNAAFVGQCREVRTEDTPAILPDRDAWDAYLPILALALCGDATSAEKAAGDISKRFPLHTLWHSAYLPAIQAAIELKHGHPGKVIDLLEAARPYERYATVPVYLRGLAYLDLRKGTESAAEFKKILDHKGVNWGGGYNPPLYPLAQVGLARATALSGDSAAAKKAYQDFFALWKDADPDQPLLIAARKEYTALH
jgi:predicted Zn-dependent protease